MNVKTLALLVCAAALCPAASYDLPVRNARVIDGTGDPWFRADVGRLAGDTAARTLDAAGRVLAPGQDKATCQQPHQFSEGFDFVLVNGQAMVEEGKLTEARPGKVLRHGRS